MSRRSVYLRGQADACRELANTIGDTDTQVELRKLADKFITRAVEIEGNARADPAARF